ncbi:MAG: topB1, partial [Firmicutes bacterium]|nr:topB1 [Bacillota bacterium]
TKKPIERLLLNEWTNDEVKKGLQNLRSNNEMQSLQDAGFGRQLADWLIGINLTSVATVKYRADHSIKVLNIGRVLLPTLKIIYDRDKEIEAFQESSYYKLIAEFKTRENTVFESTYYENELEKFETNDGLDKIKAELIGKEARIVNKTVEHKKEYAPFLFNLSNLQGYITSKYKGWTSDKVLKTAQTLYENKFITYPRTASSVLDESLIEKAEKVLNVHKKGISYEQEIIFHTSKRVFDSKKVESHSAIMPTYIVPKTLNNDEKIVYDAVVNRFLAQFMPVAEYEETVLTIKVDSTAINGVFISKGKVELNDGWKKIENVTAKEITLPQVEENEIVSVHTSEVSEVKRKAPKYHSEKTLLREMETCGRKYKDEDSEEMMLAILSGFSIGTPATRAETIKKLKDIGYIKVRGKSLVCTDLGKMIVEKFPVKELFDLEYTGKLEKTLADIEKKKFNKEDFIHMMVEFVVKSVNDVKCAAHFGAHDTISDDVEILGICPECGSPVVESTKAFGCSNWKNGCKFTIWKDDKYISSFDRKVSADMVKLLLKNGRVGLKKGTSSQPIFIMGKRNAPGGIIGNWNLLINNSHRVSCCRKSLF